MGTGARKRKASSRGVVAGDMNIPNWVKTGISIVVASFGAGVGVVLWLSTYYVTKLEFKSHTDAPQPQYVPMAEYANHVRLEEVELRKYEELSNKISSMETNIQWIKATLDTMSERQHRFDKANK